MTATASTTSAFQGGFESPVRDAQAVFRALMDAMARPGTVHPVAELARAPAPLGAVAAALAQTLCDADTPVWLDAPLARQGAITEWLAFQTGAPVTADAGQASFALIADGASLASFDRFAQGTQDYPDRSATLVVQCDSLERGPVHTLEGPGIRHRAQVAPTGLPDRFAQIWMANHALFPRGVDLVLAGPGTIAALPRTTRIAAGEV